MRVVQIVVASCLVALCCQNRATAAQSPATTVITPTSGRLAWDAYSGDVSSFVAELFAKADVNVAADGSVTIKADAAPLLTLDQGTPAIDVSSASQAGPLLGPQLTSGVEYVAFLRVLSTSGLLSTRSTPSVPFTLQTVPTGPCATHAITIAVQDWTRMVSVGARGRVLVQLANSFPLVQLQIKFGTQVVAQVDGAELRDAAGIYFSVPRTPGTYGFTVFAKDNQGCTAETTAISRSLIVF